eukprot:31137-Pelagococcus_subviridis.AAC.5
MSELLLLARRSIYPSSRIGSSPTGYAYTYYLIPRAPRRGRGARAPREVRRLRRRPSCHPPRLQTVAARSPQLRDRVRRRHLRFIPLDEVRVLQRLPRARSTLRIQRQQPKRQRDAGAVVDGAADRVLPRRRLARLHRDLPVVRELERAGPSILRGRPQQRQRPHELVDVAVPGKHRPDPRAEELAEDGPRGPDVHAGVVPTRAVQNLRRAVPPRLYRVRVQRSSASVRGGGVRLVVVRVFVRVLLHKPGESEVRELHASVGADQQVPRLDVAVHHASGVARVQREEDLPRDALHARDGERRAAAAEVKRPRRSSWAAAVLVVVVVVVFVVVREEDRPQVPARAQLHDERDRAPGREVIEQPDDVVLTITRGLGS